VSYITKNLNDAKVVDSLGSGGVGFMPSDTIYGLSGSAASQAAVERIYRLKDRQHQHRFIILISGLAQLGMLGIERATAQPAEKYWPGPLTAVLPAPQAPACLHGDTLAVRLPASLELRQLISIIGPLISTSANPTGKTPAATVAEAQAYFGEQLDFYVDAGRLAGLPSTIVRIEGDGLNVLRQGAVKIKEA
jgi:L-threonylcarbamoyladenylate synthase